MSTLPHAKRLRVLVLGGLLALVSCSSTRVRPHAGPMRAATAHALQIDEGGYALYQNSEHTGYLWVSADASVELYWLRLNDRGLPSLRKAPYRRPSASNRRQEVVYEFDRRLGRRPDVQARIDEEIDAGARFEFIACSCTQAREIP